MASLPPPYPHQARELRDNHAKPKLALHWSPRMGKTRAAAEDWIRSGVKRGIVTAPLSVCPDWVDMFVALDAQVVPAYLYPVGQLEGLRSLRNEHGIIVVINDDKIDPGCEELLRWDAQGVIFDECHRMKNPTGRRSRAMRRLAFQAERVRTLSGTPAPNSMADLWAPMNALDPEAWERSFEAFKCVVPETRVLTADMRWVQIGSVKPGDALLGFNEHLISRAHRTGETSIVVGTKRVLKECLEIVTTRGTVVCSKDHTWLVDGAQHTWVSSAQLKSGPRKRSRIVCLPVSPWEEDNSYDAGWLAGMFDGEGCLSGGILSLSQNPGPTLEHAKALLQERGVQHREFPTKPGSPCKSLIVSGRAQAMRLLGMIRPKRLLRKVEQVYGGRLIPAGGRAVFAEVLSIKTVGFKEVVAVETSTGTYIAEGLYSHNCKYLIMDPNHPARCIGQKNTAALTALVNRFASIVRREDVFGPDDFQEVVRYVDLPWRARKRYDAEATAWMRDTNNNALLHILRLRQLAAGFTGDRPEVVHDVLINRLVDDLGEVAACGQKAVVYHWFRWEGQRACHALNRLGVPVDAINGDTPAEERRRINRAFNESPGPRIVVAQIAANGTGVSFATADHLMFLSSTFSFAEMEQARDRIYAPDLEAGKGMRRVITHYRARDTIHDFIGEVQDAKGDVHEALRNCDRRAIAWGGLAQACA